MYTKLITYYTKSLAHPSLLQLQNRKFIEEVCMVNSIHITKSVCLCIKACNCKRGSIIAHML